MTGRILGTGIATLALLAAAAGAPGIAGAADITTSVVNVAPVITSVTLSTNSATPISGTTTSLTATVVATDTNGFNDITGVQVRVLKPDGSTVHVANAPATFASGSLLSATYTRTITMNFHDAPATGGSTYKVVATATDAAVATGDNALAPATFNYAELAAISLGSSSIALGTNVSPGSAGNAITLAVTNAGNRQIDVQVSGTALTHSSLAASIPLSGVTYSPNSDMSGSAALTGSAATMGTFDLASGASSSKNLYLQVAVPSGSAQWIPAGTYTGTLTVGAVAG